MKTTTTKRARKPRIVLRSTNYMENAWCAVTGKEFTVGCPFAFFLDGDLGKPVSLEAVLQHGFTMQNSAALAELLAILSWAFLSGKWGHQQREKGAGMLPCQLDDGGIPF